MKWGEVCEVKKRKSRVSVCRCQEMTCASIFMWVDVCLVKGQLMEKGEGKNKQVWLAPLKKFCSLQHVLSSFVQYDELIIWLIVWVCDESHI